jgi:hypothetical protein
MSFFCNTRLLTGQHFSLAIKGQNDIQRVLYRGLSKGKHTPRARVFLGRWMRIAWMVGGCVQTDLDRLRGEHLP